MSISVRSTFRSSSRSCPSTSSAPKPSRPRVRPRRAWTPSAPRRGRNAMSIVVVGLNHKSSPIQLIERLSIAPDDVGKALQHLLAHEHVVEGVVLSTCNRVEAYAAVTRFHAGAQDLRKFFSEFCDVAAEDFSDHLYTYF